jgi:hypothetical protein
VARNAGENGEEIFCGCEEENRTLKAIRRHQESVAQVASGGGGKHQALLRPCGVAWGDRGSDASGNCLLLHTWQRASKTGAGNGGETLRGDAAEKRTATLQQTLRLKVIYGVPARAAKCISISVSPLRCLKTEEGGSFMAHMRRVAKMSVASVWLYVTAPGVMT